MKTLFDKYQALNNEYDRMRFFFANSIAYKNKKITKAKSGVYVKGILDKEYAEIDGRFILIFKVEGKKIGSCIREIDLDVFVENMKKTHDILMMP